MLYMENDLRRFSEWGIPKRLLRATWETNNVIPDEIIKVANAYIETYPNDRGIYILSSKNGVGKTYLASLIVKELYYNKKIRKRFMFLDNGSLFEMFRDNARDSIYMDKMLTSDIIVMDDFGKGKFSEWILEQFYYVINYRYNEYLPIIFTSNFSPPQLVSKASNMSGGDMLKSIVSRIYEMCDIIDFDTFDVTDHRKQQLKVITNGTN